MNQAMQFMIIQMAISARCDSHQNPGINLTQ